MTSTLAKTTILERLRSRRRAQAAFAEAVNLLTAEPTGENVVRYLIASHDLERPGHALRRPTHG
jgi:hypothetical protein